jgi:phosphoribosylaminoimidazole carboxylase
MYIFFNRELAAVCDVLTIEIEHVNATILLAMEQEGFQIHPSPSTIKIIQDKFTQKVHLAEHGIPLPEFIKVTSLGDAIEAGRRFGYPYMLKNRLLAYDGRGNAKVSSEDSVQEAYLKLGGDHEGGEVNLYAEKWAPFTKELAVMVVRTKTRVFCYPVVETVQSDNICHLVTAPAIVTRNVAIAAEEVARRAIASFPGIGIYGVELFLLPDETILLNEIAPRFVHVQLADYPHIFTLTSKSQFQIKN